MCVSENLEAEMGAEPLSKNEVAPFVLGLQPSALVDHVARVDQSLLDQIPGEHGGSIPVFTPFTTFLHTFLINIYSELSSYIFHFYSYTRWVLIYIVFLFFLFCGMLTSHFL